MIITRIRLKINADFKFSVTGRFNIIKKQKNHSSTYINLTPFRWLTFVNFIKIVYIRYRRIESIKSGQRFIELNPLFIHRCFYDLNIYVKRDDFLF